LPNTTITTRGGAPRPDPAALKLGARPPRRDPRTLRLGAYLTSALPPPPIARDWSSKVDTWPMYGNDEIGDCTIAAAGHQVQAWTANANTEVTFADQAIYDSYAAVTGWNPNDPATDAGAVELDVLNHWRRNGIGGHRITAYAAVNLNIHEQVRSAIDLFGGLYIGLNLPASAQDQIRHTWRPVRGASGRAGSWGGHAVTVVAFNRAGLTCVTWGGLQRMSWAFFEAYCVEAYAIVAGPDWLTTAGVTPRGLNLRILLDDLHKITA
jgi:hypothetical protein